ncbi:MAG: putative phosphoesterase [Candidatus Nanohaloarchaea archaeon]|jgi:putative phosphoesterase
MIAVISDSHVPNRAPEIPKQFIEKVEEAELVVHCGDFATEEVYGEIKEFSEQLVAVKGNCDFFQLPNSETFERKGFEFGVYHGTGISPRGDHGTLLDIAENKMDVEILLHGHTHQEEIFEESGTLLLNPGSCTGVGGGSARSSNPTMMLVETGTELVVKLLELVDGEIQVRKVERFSL